MSLLAFFALAIGGAARLAIRSRGRGRVFAAAVTGACCAFAVSAAVDWVWQMPALVFAILLLIAATLVRRGPSEAPWATPTTSEEGTDRTAADTRSWRSPRELALRGGLALVAVAALVTILIPLASTSALTASQAEAARGEEAVGAAQARDLAQSLSDARAAASIEPGSASAQLQIALDLELEDQLPQAVAAAQRAITNEPLNWSSWYVLSRLEAEVGDPTASLAAYSRARSLNPKSPFFS